jgi:hypothetical protein
MDAQLGARQGRRTPTIHRDRAQRLELKSLMTLKFQRFEDVSLMAA